MNFARLVSTQSRAILVMTFLLCAAGLYAARQLPVSIFPQTNFPRVVIAVDNGVVPGKQELASVTRPIEEAMGGIPGVNRITSVTARGGTEINMFFDWDLDIVQALQMVQGRISQMASQLPSTAEITDVDRLTFAIFPVAGYSLTSDKRSPMDLLDLAEYTIRPRLSRLDGVAAVNIQGGEKREVQVIVDPAKLVARGVEIGQVVEALSATNILESPGLMEENHSLELTVVSGQTTDPDDLGKVVVAVVNGVPVSVSDVASVGTGAAPAYTIVTADGHPAVLLNIRRQPNANTIGVVDAVKAELAAMKASLPKDVAIAPFYDQSILVGDSMLSVRDSILLGLLLSVAILYAFLRNWGTTIVAILVIPVTLVATFFAMWQADLSFDLMTLGGVAASIGLVIDTAIVVVENIYFHLVRAEASALHNAVTDALSAARELAQARRKAVEDAITEISVPIIGSTLTPVVVFLPLAMLTGVTGVFFRSLAITMAVALLASLVLALTFTPVLAEKFIRVPRRALKSPPPTSPPTSGPADESSETTQEVAGQPGDGEPGAEADALVAFTHADPHAEEEEAEGGKFLQAIIRMYAWVLSRALNWRKTVIFLSAAAGVAALLLVSQLGSDFLPAFDEGAFVLDYEAPPGTSLVETDRLLKHVERILEGTPEVEGYSRRTGLQLGVSLTEPNTGDFLVKLKGDRDRSIDEVTEDVRRQIEGSEPALRVEFAGILGDLVGDLIESPSPVEIKLFSDDTAALEAKAHAVEDLIQTVPGVVDTFSGVVVSGPALTFQVDPVRAARRGVTVEQVAATVQTAMDGVEATQVLQHGRLITVRVRLPGSVRDSLDSLRALPIRSGDTWFRLDQVADLSYESGVTEIHRDGLRQTVAVTARLEGVDLGTGIAAIKKELAAKMTFPPGMTVEYGGIYQEEQKSFRELLIALVLAVVLVFLVLLVEFQSFAHPVAIVSGSVLSLSGVVVAMFVTGTTLNIVSFMGMIMVVGIVAKNGILMLDAVEDHRRNGDSMREALLRSGRRRFRPVLMTSLATILGMAPLAFAIGSGSELLQPLAIGVIGGVMMALVMSLVLSPVVYSVIQGE